MCSFKPCLIIIMKLPSMKKSFPFVILCIVFMIFSCTSKREGTPKVVVFSKTMGFTHASIPLGIEAIHHLGSEHAFVVDMTKKANIFTEEN